LAAGVGGSREHADKNDHRNFFYPTLANTFIDLFIYGIIRLNMFAANSSDFMRFHLFFNF
jgi:hypothetical protein